MLSSRVTSQGPAQYGAVSASDDNQKYDRRLNKTGTCIVDCCQMCCTLSLGCLSWAPCLCILGFTPVPNFWSCLTMLSALDACLASVDSCVWGAGCATISQETRENACYGCLYKASWKKYLEGKMKENGPYDKLDPKTLDSYITEETPHVFGVIDV